MHHLRQSPDSRVLLITFSDPLAHALRGKMEILAGVEDYLLDRISIASFQGIAEELQQLVFGRKAYLASRDFIRSLVLRRGTRQGSTRSQFDRQPPIRRPCAATQSRPALRAEHRPRACAHPQAPHGLSAGPPSSPSRPWSDRAWSPPPWRHRFGRGVGQGRQRHESDFPTWHRCCRLASPAPTRRHPARWHGWRQVGYRRQLD
jgi:hypothetical protein